MTIRLLAFLILLPVVLMAAEPVVPPVAVAPRVSPTVATINGIPLTLRDIEDSLFRREGGELVEEWVHHQLESLDFLVILLFFRAHAQDHFLNCVMVFSA